MSDQDAIIAADKATIETLEKVIGWMREDLTVLAGYAMTVRAVDSLSDDGQRDAPERLRLLRWCVEKWDRLFAELSPAGQIVMRNAGDAIAVVEKVRAMVKA